MARVPQQTLLCQEHNAVCAQLSMMAKYITAETEMRYTKSC